MHRRYAALTVTVLLLNAILDLVELRVWPQMRATWSFAPARIALAAVSLAAVVAVVANWQREIAAASALFAVWTASLFTLDPILAFGGTSGGDRALISLRGAYAIGSVALEPLAAFLLAVVVWDVYGPAVGDGLRRLRAQFAALRRERRGTATVVALLLIEGLTAGGMELTFPEEGLARFAAFAGCGLVSVVLAHRLAQRTTTFAVAAAALWFGGEIVAQAIGTIGTAGGMCIPFFAAWAFLRCNDAWAERVENPEFTVKVAGYVP